MRTIILSSFILLIYSCGIYKPYSRPEEIHADSLYGARYNTTDTVSFATLGWKDLFTDSFLQALIEQGLADNTDLQSAEWKIKEAEAAFKTARLNYLPSFNLTPNGSTSSFDRAKASWTYSVPVTASWEIDLFGRISNAKKQAKSLYLQSMDYRQAVQTGLIAAIANQYYTLLMLDEQYRISKETAGKYKESVTVMQAMKEAGMTNEAGVSQMEGACFAVQSALHDLARSINEVENSLSALLGKVPHHIKRGILANQHFPSELSTGIPIQLLSRRPDIRATEQSLAQAYYATNIAKASLYPSLTLSGTAGWTNALGSAIVDPGKLLLSAAGALFQPIFNAGANRARLKIAQAQQEEAKLAFQQALLNAGAEVNTALTQYQEATAKTEWRTQQITSLEKAVETTQLLMKHSSVTYLEVLTAQQALLQAKISQAEDNFETIQGVINLYHALGGGQ